MTTRRRQPRLSVDPLEAWLNARYVNIAGSADAQLDGRLSARRIAEILGYERLDSGRSTVQRWRSSGVPLYAADLAAIRAGVHPTEIWPEFATIEH